MLCRKYIITRILIGLPLRLAISFLGSLGYGVLLFFHGVFFACILVFIYSIIGGHSKLVIEWVGYACIGLLLIPVLTTITSTLLDEIRDFKQTN